MYVPLNTSVYNAAFTGAFSGMTASMRSLRNPNSNVYTPAAKAAGAWAEAFDTVWAGAHADSDQLETIVSSSEGSWDGLSPANKPASFLAATYTIQVTAIIASITSASAYLAANVAPSVQTTYFVNAATGDDKRSGATSLLALKTISALSSRLQSNVTALPVSVTLETDFGLTDPLILDDYTGNLSITGTRVQVRAGIITGFTPVNRGLNTITQLTDALVADWTPDLSLLTGRRVRNTMPGPNLDQIAYVAANVGAGAAKTDVPYTLNIDEGVFAPGDTYVVESLTKLFVSTLSSSGRVGFGGGGIKFTDLDIQGFPLIVSMTGNSFTSYVGCHIAPLALVSGDALTVSFLKCCGRRGVAATDGTGDVLSGLWGGNPLDQSAIGVAGGILRVDFDATCWNSAIRVKVGGLVIGLAAAFNAPLINGCGAGLQVGYGLKTGTDIPQMTQCSAALYNLNSPSHALYGSGNAETGVAVGAGSIMSFSGNPPTIVGALGDFKLGTGGKERAFNEAAGAYTAPIAPTWANLAIATPAGFGGNAHDMSSESHLVTFV